MTVDPAVAQTLVDLGLTKPEADAYLQLLEFAHEGPATGYQVAKALGKDATAVYKALEELKRRGAVEMVVGRGKQYRPVAPEEMMRQLQRAFRRRTHEARQRMAALQPAPPAEEVFRLHTRAQVHDRFTELLDGCTDVALLDLAPRMVRHYRRRIERAVDRGVTVVVKLYRPEGEPLPCETVVEPDGPALLELMPGDVLHGAFDCRRQLVTYLPRPGQDDRVAQAFWTANAFLAYQAHSGLASEIIHTELRAMLALGVDTGTMQLRHETLARLCHGPVDWEGFWEEAGMVPGRGIPADLFAPVTGPPEPSIRLRPEGNLPPSRRARKIMISEQEIRSESDGMVAEGDFRREYPRSITEEIVERKRRITSEEGRSHARRHPEPDDDD